ncbi:peptidogalycan biosysnthesis protein [Rhizobacter fulvus]|jgi:hypothetical protein
MVGTADARKRKTEADSDGPEGSNDYVIRVFDDPGQIDAAAWNELVAAQASATPFMRHEYLLALHRSESAVARTGWLPQFLAVFDGTALIAACPLYLKEHSYGEYDNLCRLLHRVHIALRLAASPGHHGLLGTEFIVKPHLDKFRCDPAHMGKP